MDKSLTEAIVGGGLLVFALWVLVHIFGWEWTISGAVVVYLLYKLSTNPKPIS